MKNWRAVLIVAVASLVAGPAALSTPTPPTPPHIVPPTRPVFCPGFPFCTPAPTARVYIIRSGDDLTLHAKGLSTGGNTGAYAWTFESLACGTGNAYWLGGSGVVQKGDEVVTLPVNIADLYNGGEVCDVIAWLRLPGTNVTSVLTYPDGTSVQAEYDLYD